MTVGDSDHYTTLLKIPQNVTKLLITARSSFQGCLSPALTRVPPTRPQPQPLTPLPLYSATSHACLTPSPRAGVFPLPSLLFSFSRSALLVVYKRCPSSVHPRRSRVTHRTQIAKNLAKEFFLLGWPRSSLGFFRKMLLMYMSGQVPLLST